MINSGEYPGDYEDGSAMHWQQLREENQRLQRELEIVTQNRDELRRSNAKLADRRYVICECITNLRLMYPGGGPTPSYSQCMDRLKQMCDPPYRDPTRSNWRRGEEDHDE